MAKRRDGPDQFASKKPRLIDNDSYRSEEDSHSKQVCPGIYQIQGFIRYAFRIQESYYRI